MQNELYQNQKSEFASLQNKQDILAGQIRGFGIKIAILVFIFLCLSLIIEDLQKGYLIVNHVFQYFIIAITIIASSFSVGFDISVQIFQAHSVKKMLQENILIRNLDSCQKLGMIDNICSDKTGVLTKNEMEVLKLWTLQQEFQIFDEKTMEKQSDARDKLCIGICVNSQEQPNFSAEQFVKIGNTTECALLEMAYRMGYNFEKYRNDDIVRVVPFSSKKKRMSVIYRLNETTYRVFVKGAPDWLHQYTTSYLDKFGNIQQINEDFENSRDKQIKNYADHALRTLLLCYKDVPVNELNADVEDLEYLETQLEKQLIVIGVVGIQDPLRPEVEGAIRTCQNAGVTVRMFTGDSADSAIAISKNAGIIEKNYDPNLDKHVVMTGPEFSEFVGGRKEIKDDEGKVIKYEIGNLEKFKIVYEKTRVIARSSPEDKYLLVTGIRQLGHVVAVTGDGTNDAPALKKADVGFAWNIQGTQVAKEASDIIVLNDSFNSIVAAILQGKHNLDCIRKFLYFQVVLNIVAILMVTLSAIALRESPLGLLQVLWINVFVSSFIIYAQIWEKPQESLIKTKPQGKFEAMITPIMWRNIIGQGIWQIFVLLVVLFKGAEIFSIPTGIHNEHWTQENGQHYTIFFNIFVYMQVFNEINARKLKKEEKNVFSGFFNNPLFLIVIIFTIFVQILLTTYGGLAVGFSDLTMHQHFVCLAIGASSLIVGYLIKLLPEACFNSIFLFRNFEEEEEEEKEEKQDSQFKLESSKDKNI